jgi:hypothetical protein
MPVVVDFWVAVVLWLLQTGRITYVTPTSYLELIKAFSTLLVAKRSEVS